MRRSPATIWAFAVLLPLAASARGADDLAAERQRLGEDYARSLADLAARCDEQGQSDAARATRQWLVPRDPNRLYVWDVPAARRAARELVEGQATGRDEWAERFDELRDERADALFGLARRAAQAKHPLLAFELVNEALHENPDHKPARRVVGHIWSDDAWRTPFELQQRQAGLAWHERFGWLKQAHVERYERGERLLARRWVSAEADEAAHREIRHGWQIETEHYRVATNHSLEAGVELAARLERLYRAWQQAFVGYAISPDELIRWFDGKGTRWRDGVKHQVTYFRTRDEYNRVLKGSQPKIEMTLGIYFDQSQTAYFFAGENQDAGTLFHEATHQLFHETRRVAPHVGQQDNFWVVEAVACYFESLAEHEGFTTLGGLDAGRVPAARHRLLVDEFYVPLADLVRFGMDDLQRDSRIAPLYSQSAGLATFLIHDRAGRHREPLVAYLVDVYSGRAAPDSLAKRSGVSLEELDRQYREFMTPATGE